MDRVLAINTKDMREAKGMQMLKANEITKSARRLFQVGHASPHLWQSDFTWSDKKAKVL